MGHLDGRKFPNADRRPVSVFFHVLIVQLDDTPDTAAEQPIVFSRVLFIDRDVFQSKVGKLCFIEVSLNIQVYGDLVDHRITAPLPENGEDLLRLIRADKIVRENVLDVVHAFLNDLGVIGAAILPQKELQDIHGDICPLFDFLGQVFADDFSIKLLPQFRLDDSSCVICLCKAGQSYRPLSYILV